jgi:hypothetical protein
MSKQDRRVSSGTARGIAMAIGAAVMVLAVGSCAPETDPPNDVAMQSETPIGAETQGRTPINVASLGPQVGEQVPGFSLPDQNGEVRTLESILGPRGAMLLFHRSADW